MGVSSAIRRGNRRSVTKYGYRLLQSKIGEKYGLGGDALVGLSVVSRGFTVSERVDLRHNPVTCSLGDDLNDGAVRACISCIADMHDVHTCMVSLLHVTAILVAVEGVRLVAQFVLDRSTWVMLAKSVHGSGGSQPEPAHYNCC